MTPIETPPPFSLELIDDGTSRGDLTARQEMKYVFRAPDPDILRAALRRACRPVIYAGRVSTVNSIYFDDDRLHTCQANLDGIGRRCKLRVRWYDRATPDRDIYFEIKWRENRVTGEHRVRLAASDETGRVRYRDLIAALRRAVPAALQPAIARYDQPVVLVEYHREHFASLDGDARLTLDYDMCFYPQYGRRHINRKFGQPLSGVVLVEGKVGVGKTVALQRVVAPLRRRPSRFSKYVIGCQQLGYANDF